MSSKEWGSILSDALNESQDLKDAIIGGVSKRQVRAAIEQVIQDHNYFMSTFDAYSMVMEDPDGKCSEIIEEYGSIAEMTCECETKARRTRDAFR